MAEITLIIAFIAGVVSFVSPCILPLIPGYLAYLAGTTVSEAAGQRKEVFINSVFFVLGLSIVFALLGVFLNTILERVAYDAQVWLSRIAGLVIIFFGVYLLGLFQLPFLEREYKLSINLKFQSKYLSSFVFGAAFGAAWTPCVSIVLGSILALAAVEPGSAFALLFAYALGLGIPFLIVGGFVSQAATFIKEHQTGFYYFRIVFGVILIILGILAFTQNLSRVANLGIVNTILLS